MTKEVRRSSTDRRSRSQPPSSPPQVPAQKDPEPRNPLEDEVAEWLAMYHDQPDRRLKVLLRLGEALKPAEEEAEAWSVWPERQSSEDEADEGELEEGELEEGEIDEGKQDEGEQGEIEQDDTENERTNTARNEHENTQAHVKPTEEEAGPDKAYLTDAQVVRNAWPAFVAIEHPVEVLFRTYPHLTETSDPCIPDAEYLINTLIDADPEWEQGKLRPYVTLKAYCACIRLLGVFREEREMRHKKMWFRECEKDVRRETALLEKNAFAQALLLKEAEEALRECEGNDDARERVEEQRRKTDVLREARDQMQEQFPVWHKRFRGLRKEFMQDLLSSKEDPLRPFLGLEFAERERIKVLLRGMAAQWHLLSAVEVLKNLGPTEEEGERYSFFYGDSVRGGDVRNWRPEVLEELNVLAERTEGKPTRAVTWVRQKMCKRLQGMLDGVKHGKFDGGTWVLAEDVRGVIEDLDKGVLGSDDDDDDDSDDDTTDPALKQHSHPPLSPPRKHAQPPRRGPGPITADASLQDRIVNSRREAASSPAPGGDASRSSHPEQLKRKTLTTKEKTSVKRLEDLRARLASLRKPLKPGVQETKDDGQWSDNEAVSPDPSVTNEQWERRRKRKLEKQAKRIAQVEMMNRHRHLVQKQLDLLANRALLPEQEYFQKQQALAAEQRELGLEIERGVRQRAPEGGSHVQEQEQAQEQEQGEEEGFLLPDYQETSDMPGFRPRKRRMSVVERRSQGQAQEKRKKTASLDSLYENPSPRPTRRHVSLVQPSAPGMGLNNERYMMTGALPVSGGSEGNQREVIQQDESVPDVGPEPEPEQQAIRKTGLRAGAKKKTTKKKKGKVTKKKEGKATKKKEKKAKKDQEPPTRRQPRRRAKEGDKVYK